MPTPHGLNALVLHGHLPWVHHPDVDDFLEEDWYFEAVLETYLPLLYVLEDLARDRIPVRLTVGLTPPLLEMFRAESLREKTERFIRRRIELAKEERERLAHDALGRRVAAHYLGRFEQLYALWAGLRGDLVLGFRRHMKEGRLEILASCATHGVLPLITTKELRQTQVRIGVDLFKEVFDASPGGFWLPECAFVEGVDRVLADAGLKYVILESHGILGADPAPRSQVARPVRLPAGIAAFGRDPSSSRQVWSAEVGYPGDPDYRELYRDLGFDGAYQYVKPWLHGDGVRRNLGFKYHRVTGKVALHEKLAYDPDVARQRAREHAGHFLLSRGEQSRRLLGQLGEPPVILSPYDMELFGHWWYEGPHFLEALFRQMADPARRPPLRLGTPLDALREPGSLPAVQPGLSTWGEAGFLKVWLNEENSWVLRHQSELERRMVERAREHSQDPAPQVKRLLDQMLREVLLAQSSDWAFILTKETAVHYAKKRVTDHVDRFLGLELALSDPDSLDPAWLARVESADSLFPGLDFRVVLGGPCTRSGPLGTPGPLEPARPPW